MENTTAPESTETTTREEARAHGIAIANDRHLSWEALQDLATYGFKLGTGHPEASELDYVVRCAANDEAKRLVAEIEAKIERCTR